jgi:hypothetical protein
MSVRSQHNRTENTGTRVGDKYFIIQRGSSRATGSNSTLSSMRQAAKRFIETPQFTADCLYYDGFMVNGKWQFRAVGLGQKF